MTLANNTILITGSAVRHFIEVVFQQPKEGKREVTSVCSELMAKASQEDLKKSFTQLNPS